MSLTFGSHEPYLESILRLITAKSVFGMDEFYRNTPGACPGEMYGHRDCGTFHDICLNYPLYFFSYFLDDPLAFDHTDYVKYLVCNFKYTLAHPGIYQGYLDTNRETHEFILLVYANKIRVMGSYGGSLRLTNNVFSHENFRYLMNEVRKGSMDALKKIFQIEKTDFESFKVKHEEYYNLTEALHVDRILFEKPSRD